MAKADELSLQVQKKVADHQISMITGEPPDNADFILPSIHGKHQIPDMGDVVKKVRKMNPAINVARENANVAKCNITTVVGQAGPSVYYTNLKTQYIGQTTNNNVITVNFPITIGGYVQIFASVKQYFIADSQCIDVEAKTELEAESLVSVSQVGLQVLDIKKAAVDSAKLSVEAN
jgi:outer membrane protein TolC